MLKIGLYIIFITP